MDVRLARDTDADDVRRLVDEAFTHYIPRIGRKPMPMEADYAELVALGRCWVVDGDAGLLGMLHLETSDDHLEVVTIAVAPSGQGHGVGGLLLAFADEKARALGLPEVRLCTNEAMTENIAYYPRRGFREVGRSTEQGFKRVFFAKRL
ncbi:GNAT family N-acetyltransferase [Actinoplanes sp. Pm04-4]|uniref:GNAT family N-acetyltransferase n=1 Tax=Paractinoplanes pyxinae TaxID=2997416 RepID=A0ABT4BEX7_9ACTN|nr:GNAT family N-acetyltransferase [Actinoplanes pyxinae]MCY1145083.1 GNAT family N-acetyltransferase [Actinoplanes pyxinae]